MSRLRKLIIAFWIFIGIMLLWQFYNYDKGIREVPAQQQHFYFYPPTNAPAASQAPAHLNGPDVKQIAFSVKKDTPGRGSFTCNVTLKNVGNAKAVDVQIHVQPFRGTTSYDDDVGHASGGTLSESDPMAQFGQWVDFPDLAPGESSTQSVVFTIQTNRKPGEDPKAEIIFKAEKANP